MTTQQNVPLTREETAWLMKALWKALQAPKWTFQNKKDLGKLGEAIFSGKELRDLDDALLDRIFPHLVTVTNDLGCALKAKAEENDEQAPSTPSTTTPPTPLLAPAPILPTSAPETPTTKE